MNPKGQWKSEKKVAKLLKVTTIKPYRPMSDLIIEEIDDD